MSTFDNDTLDQQILSELKEATEEMFPEIIESFLEDTPNRIQHLCESIEKNDFQSMTEQSHCIKGSSSNIGALKLSAICAEFEKQSRSGEMTDQKELFNQISSEFSLVEERLRQESTA